VHLECTFEVEGKKAHIRTRHSTTGARNTEQPYKRTRWLETDIKEKDNKKYNENKKLFKWSFYFGFPKYFYNDLSFPFSFFGDFIG
jgi:hypothetical protein